MNKNSFLTLIDKIIDEEYEESKTLYYFERDSIYEVLTSHRENVDVLSMNQFGLSPEDIQNYMTFITATLEAFIISHEFVKSKKKDDTENTRDEMREKWILILTKKGIKKSKAKKIVKKHFDEFYDTIQKNQQC